MNAKLDAMNKEKAMIPELRFGEFEGEWEESRINTHFNLTSGQHLGPSEYFDQRLDNTIRYFTGPSDFNSTNEQSQKWSDKKNKTAKSGDLLITVKGSSAGSVYLLSLTEVILGRQLMSLRSKKDYSIKFLELRMSRLQNYFSALASGNMIPGLSRNDVLKTKISFPTLPEQKKIAAFLTATNESIRLLEAKLSRLKDYKRGLLQRIFSQELRFKDDDGREFPDWVEKRLGELGKFKNGINKSKNDFGHGAPFINLLDVFGKTSLGQDNYGLVNTTRAEQELYNLDKGDVLFIRSSVKRTGVGEAVVVLENLNQTVYSGFLIRFREVDTELHLLFKKYCFAAEGIRKNILSLATTSANTNINQEALQEVKLTLPTLPEQKKIAAFLAAVDDRLALVEEQLVARRVWKRGLLQRLLV